MQRVINFSGGKTSAYMTITEYREGDIVLFCDTGREHEKTYKFIHDFEAHEGIPVTWATYKNALNPFDAMLKERFDRGNTTMPFRMRRFCSDELKVKTARRFMLSQGHKKYVSLIGFRKDEPVRVLNWKERLKSVKTVFPLYENGIDKQQVNAYWAKKPYTLEIPHILGNCTLCFMKGQNAVMAILREYPELADPWINDERQAAKTYKHTYFPNITIEQMRNIAQNNLFKDYDLNEIKPAFDCACTA